jgi:hypothetical protein
MFGEEKALCTIGNVCSVVYREGWRHLYEPDMARGLTGECREPGPGAGMCDGGTRHKLQSVFADA